MHSLARFWLAAISLFAIGCARAPETYPAPDQHRPFRPHGVTAAEFLSVEDPQLRQAVIKDVAVDVRGEWRWTGGDPELRFTLASTESRSLVVEFVIHERTFRETGPLAISFYVNGHLADEQRYTSDGHKRFEKIIPSEWLTAQSEARVRMHIHNPWRSPDNETLGVLLKRIGFVE